MARRPALVVTTGDPCGIGPEIILRSLLRAPRGVRSCLIIGDLSVYRAAARRLRIPLPSWRTITLDQACARTPEAADGSRRKCREAPAERPR